MIYSYFNPNLEKSFNENNVEFQSKKDVFHKVVTKIEKEYILNYKSEKEIDLNVEKLPDEIKEQLLELGINKVLISFDNLKKCNKKYEISFVANEGWNVENLNNVMIVYSPCDNTTIENNHTFDGYHIDTWGQGENWYIYSDTDSI